MGAWVTGGAWKETWARLTDLEQDAAATLEITGPWMWNNSFGSADKKGSGLSGVWTKSWTDLTSTESHAAKLLGIAGAGAWDRSKSSSSPEKEWARLSNSERTARVESW